jgi:Zn-dependent M16 (insulinase) family peptidase
VTWTLVSSTPVPGLAITAELRRHAGGLTHWHLACEDPHQAFSIAFRTAPTDSSGLPHVLEHTVLCGSRLFPVRDPFFAMLRRSLQTFMNAMTYGEFTAYPFATQVPADFDNLLAIYLDAVFAPRLDPRDFAQEGHRLQPDGSAWTRTGVVYHEMQGAFDGTAPLVERAVARAALGGTCWGQDSGGDPAEIPRIDHAALTAFHRRCYCPANAVLTTYGAVDLPALHARLAPYLADSGVPLAPPAPQAPWSGPRQVEVAVPWGEDAELADASLAGLHWLQGDLADLDEALSAELVDRLLTGHAGSPLRLALESSGMGRSIGGTGFHGSARSGLFTAEIEGIEPADLHRLEPLVDECLRTVARDGLPPDELAAALHQVELSRREIGGDHLPFGLELCLRLVAPWCWGSDPLPFLDQAAGIARLTAAVADPVWLAAQIHRRFLDNPSRLEVIARPDRLYGARTTAAAAAAARAAAAAAGEDGRERLRSAATELEVWQRRRDDPALLPSLGLADVPAERPWAVGTERGGLTVFTTRTNGLAHHLVAVPLPALSDDELDLLPLWVLGAGQVGVGEDDYAAFAARVAGCAAGVSAWTELVADPDDPGRVRAWLFAESRGLYSRRDRFAPLADAVIDATRTDEADRWTEIIDQEIARHRGRIAPSGSAYAVRAAMRGLPGAAGLAHRLAGLGRLAWLESGRDGLDDLLPRLASLGRKLATLPRSRGVIVDDPAARTDWIGAATADAGEPWLSADPPEPAPPTAFTTAAAVNHCALVFPAPPAAHPDAGALAVGCRLLTDRELHPRIRERGGAYGASAAWSAATAAVQITSYRDPRLTETFRDMREALLAIAARPADDRALLEAKLGVIAGLDAPGSPSGEARGRFIADRTGHGPAVTDALRRRILAADAAAVREAVARWLPADGGRTACVTSPQVLAASGLGWLAEAV